MSAPESEEWATVQKLLALADAKAGSSVNEARNAITAAAKILQRLFENRTTSLSADQVQDLVRQAEVIGYARGYRDAWAHCYNTALEAEHAKAQEEAARQRYVKPLQPVEIVDGFKRAGSTSGGWPPGRDGTG